MLKIVASSENILFLTRENHYGPADYEKGFRLAYSKVRRNETSPLTYRKSLNYGDCILEKRAVRGTEIQEPIFLNTRGEIAEGATSNIFFVKDGILYTPEVDSGLLPRNSAPLGCWKTLKKRENRWWNGGSADDVKDFEECFVTNSLMGIMPVTALGEVEFRAER